MKLAFADIDQNIYFAELMIDKYHPEVDRFYKLRSVSIYSKGSQKIIEFFNYSSLLLLKDHFKDVVALKKALENFKTDQTNLHSKTFVDFNLEKFERNPIMP